MASTAGFRSGASQRQEKGLRKKFPRFKTRNPLKSLYSDERIQGNPRLISGGLRSETATRQESPNGSTGPMSRPPAEKEPNRLHPKATRASARPRSHVGALAGPWTVPDFHRLARWRIEEALARKAPVRSRRSVERAPLVAALAEEEPDQKERKTEAEGQDNRDHDTGSITAAVP